MKTARQVRTHPTGQTIPLERKDHVQSNAHDEGQHLVTLTDGNAVTTSLVIAEGTDVQHKNLRELIQDNLADFEEFGGVRFETAKPSEGSIGGRPVKYAVLNEQHATLLMTYMRNSEVVREFKKRLVKAFFELAAQRPALPAIPQTYAEALRAAADAHERAEVEAAARAEAEQRSRELEAPARAWSHMADSTGDYSVADAAKVLSRDPAIRIGRDRLFKRMQGEGWVYRDRGTASWRAYQTQVDCGRLVEKLGSPYLHEPTGEMRVPNPTIRITPKGLAELHKRLGGSGQTAILAEVAS